MGSLLSCCDKKNPVALNDDRAALRAGGRINVKRNEVEDPRAPLLTKTVDTPKSKETELFDEELDDYVKGLSSDDALIGSDDASQEGFVSKNE